MRLVLATIALLVLAAPAGASVDLMVVGKTRVLREAAPVAGLICFFDERVDVTVDGEPQERPLTPWSDG